MATAEIITIGNELLSGRTIDSNAAAAAKVLTELGIAVFRRLSVGDDVPLIALALRDAASRADVVIVSGGLGPTSDDLTAAAAAEAFGQELRLLPEAEAHVRNAFARRNLPMAAVNLKQAVLPAAAAVLGNPSGTAPAFTMEHGSSLLVFLPGVPHELEALLRERVGPLLRNRFSSQPRPSVTLRLFGIGESMLAELLGRLLPPPPWLTLSYLPHFPDLSLILSAREPADQPRLEHHVAKTEALLGHVVYARGETTLPQVVIDMLQREQATVALAESCTGGLVAKLLTDISGSSCCVESGAVTYSNAAKTRMLGVPADVIATYGAVSDPVARLMAEGARTRAETTYGIGITGIAGPSGGTPEKPVGTVFISLAAPEETYVLAFTNNFPTRSAIRYMAAFRALSALLQHLKTGAPWIVSPTTADRSATSTS